MAPQKGRPVVLPLVTPGRRESAACVGGSSYKQSPHPPSRGHRSAPKQMLDTILKQVKMTILSLLPQPFTI